MIATTHEATTNETQQANVAQEVPFARMRSGPVTDRSPSTHQRKEFAP